MIQRLLIFANPRAGSGRRRGDIALLAESLRQHGLTVQVSDQVTTLVRLTTATGGSDQPPVDLVIAAGGDGTLGLVLSQTPPSPLIAVYPLGTENLVAKQFGISADVAATVDSVLAGRTVAIDAGSANGKLFLIMLTCGFDAEVVAQMHRQRRGSIRRWSYLGPIAKVLGRYRFPPLTVTFSDAAEADAVPSPQSQSLTCRWAMLFNLPQYAIGLSIEPAADGHDGRLNLCALPGGSLFSGLRYLVGTSLRRHSWLTDIDRRQLTACTITADQPVAFQIDGDPGGQLPVTVQVLPGRVRLRLPA